MTRKKVTVGILVVVIIAAAIIIIFSWQLKLQAKQEQLLQSAMTATANSAAAATANSAVATEQYYTEGIAGTCYYLESMSYIPTERSAKGSLWLFWFKGGELTQSFSPVPIETAGYADSVEKAQTIICVFEEESVVQTCNYKNTSKTITRMTYNLTVNLVDWLTLEIMRQIVYPGSKPPFCPLFLGGSRILYGTPSADINEITNWAQQYWSP